MIESHGVTSMQRCVRNTYLQHPAVHTVVSIASKGHHIHFHTPFTPQLFRERQIYNYSHASLSFVRSTSRTKSTLTYCQFLQEVVILIYFMISARFCPPEGGSKCEIPWEFLCCNDDVIFFSENKMTSSLQHKNSQGISHLEPP